MYAHQRGLARERAHDQGEVMTPIQPATKNLCRKFAEFRGERLSAHGLNQLFALGTVLDELLDRHHPQTKFALKFGELRQSLHRAIIVYKFAQYPAGVKSRQYR
jgi:hypothetical protein